MSVSITIIYLFTWPINVFWTIVLTCRRNVDYILSWKKLSYKWFWVCCSISMFGWKVISFGRRWRAVRVTRIYTASIFIIVQQAIGAIMCFIFSFLTNFVRFTLCIFNWRIFPIFPAFLKFNLAKRWYRLVQ